MREGRIVALGPSAEIDVPEGAMVVEGNGRYLMPGLVDMHVHVEYPNDLLLFVTNGVTSVRNMWGNDGRKRALGLADQLQLKRQIAAGELLGPTIYTAGPLLEGSPAFHPLAEPLGEVEAAQAAVRWQAAQGYDFVKVYDHLSAEVYAAVVDTAAEVGLVVVGHVPFEVGLDGVLGSGQVTIDHLTGYIDPDAVTWLIPEADLAAYARRTREAGVWNVVTLSEYPKSQ